VRTARLLLEARHAADVPVGVFSARMASLLRRYDLPRPEPEHLVRDARGGFIAFVDFAYVSERLAIEVDGYEPHSSLRGFTSGVQRDRLLHEAGWEPLHFTWDEVEREAASVADEIRGALIRRQRQVA
jgi:hypothetical protein